MIILNIILIIIIGILACFVIKNSKKSDKDNTYIENNNENEKEKYNYITATYSVESGKKCQIIKSGKVNLKDNDYIVEILDKNNNFRNLRAISINNGYYTPSESGYINIKITFKVILNSLNEMFKDTKELINIDLSHFEMENILSMNSTFSGCLNLNNIKFEGINTSNLIEMVHTFENCKNLKNIDLSPIKSDNLIIMKGIFSECDKLENINLSSFEKINKNLFEGIKSFPNIIANKYTSEAILNIFNNLFNIKINITIIEDQKNENNKLQNCIIGENEKCRECSTLNPKTCLYCNEGYYIPLNKNNYTSCLPCNKTIENCFTCFGDTNYIFCSSCFPKFRLDNNKCVSKYCLIGEKENVKTVKKMRN